MGISGPDAKDFLHRVSTVNLKTLAVNRGAPGCFLTGQGKLRSAFTLWRVAESEFGLELDAGNDGVWLKNTLDFIDQFTFAEKMTVQTQRSSCLWLLGEGIPSPLDAYSALDRDGLRFFHHGSRDFGRPWVSLWGATAENPGEFAAAPSVEDSQIEAWRIEALSPRVGYELTETVLPLEVSLSHAISGNKGCYPGQEVIERIISQGAPPRRLALLAGQGSPGEELLDPSGTSAGVVTSVSPDASKFLAILRKSQAEEGRILHLKNSGTNASVIRVSSYE